MERFLAYLEGMVEDLARGDTRRIPEIVALMLLMFGPWFYGAAMILTAPFHWALP